MDSRELGLVLGQTLLGLEDLHYGLWEPEQPLSFAEAVIAQQAYTTRMLDLLPPAETAPRVLDVGCGTGLTLMKLLDRGYQADGLVPSKFLAETVRGRIAERENCSAIVHECIFEDIDLGKYTAAYDALVFSESFQYMDPDEGLALANKVLRPGGVIVMFDYFRIQPADGGPRVKVVGGGHPLERFQASVDKSAFELLSDEDHTVATARTIDFFNFVLQERIQPSLQVLAAFAEEKRPWIMRWGKYFARRKIEKLQKKYFSGLMSSAEFIRSNSYRLMSFRRSG